MLVPSTTGRWLDKTSPRVECQEGWGWPGHQGVHLSRMSHATLRGELSSRFTGSREEPHDLIECFQL